MRREVGIEKQNQIICCCQGHPYSTHISPPNAPAPMSLYLPIIWPFLGSGLECKLIPHALTSHLQTPTDSSRANPNTPTPGSSFPAVRVAPWVSHTMLSLPIGLFLCFSKPGHICICLYACLPRGPDLPRGMSSVPVAANAAAPAAAPAGLWSCHYTDKDPRSEPQDSTCLPD